jgi:hypothetical protein
MDHWFVETPGTDWDPMRRPPLRRTARPDHINAVFTEWSCGGFSASRLREIQEDSCGQGAYFEDVYCDPTQMVLFLSPPNCAKYLEHLHKEVLRRPHATPYFTRHYNHLLDLHRAPPASGSDGFHYVMAELDRIHGSE